MSARGMLAVCPVWHQQKSSCIAHSGLLINCDHHIAGLDHRIHLDAFLQTQLLCRGICDNGSDLQALRDSDYDFGAHRAVVDTLDGSLDDIPCTDLHPDLLWLIYLRGYRRGLSGSRLLASGLLESILCKSLLPRIRAHVFDEFQREVL